MSAKKGKVITYFDNSYDVNMLIDSNEPFIRLPTEWYEKFMTLVPKTNVCSNIATTYPTLTISIYTEKTEVLSKTDYLLTPD